MSNIFPYADVDTGSIAALIQVAPQLASTTTPPNGLGFSLVKDVLVSNTFLNTVESELGHHLRLNCFAVTRVSDLFTQTFLDSLTPLELEVLGACVLMLIKKGSVPISLIDTEKAA
ncbi:MAG: hypothetical protein IPG23_11435 [Burkholderiales bacterium]|nr:hypothetical protein [Burkholderiales bacterium]